MVTTRLTQLMIATLASTFLVTTAGSAFAGPAAGSASPPRRVEVNNRLANQNNRINQDRRDGELSHGQARQLHHEDHQIRQEEHSMASMDGGHITRADQRALNQQENHVNRQMARDTGHFDATHPRRAEVNDRLANQDHRINRERRDGDITGAQAHQLHSEDRQVAQEEHSMASMDGGHITRADQTALNQQENGISRQIYQDR
jgi:hypothetical protein